LKSNSICSRIFIGNKWLWRGVAAGSTALLIAAAYKNRYEIKQIFTLRSIKKYLLMYPKTLASIMNFTAVIKG
jgi:hypothetical protein